MQNPEAVVPFLRLRMAFDSFVALSRSAALSVAPVFRTSIIALLVAISYYAGSQIGFLLTPAGTPISTFWPPNAILLAVFLLTPPRIWWVLVLAVLPAHFLVQLTTGIPALTSLGFLAGNAGEALFGAVCIRLFKRERPLFESAQAVVIFLAFGVLLAPLVTSFVDAGAAISIGHGKSYWLLWATRLTTNMVSILTVVPPIVIFGASGFSWLRRASVARFFEAGVLAVAVVALSLLVFGKETTPGSFATAIIYVPILALLWAALRFGAGGLSASMLGVALISSWNVVHGRGLLGASSADRVVSLHILLAIFAVPLLLTAALMAERRRDRETLRNTRRNLIYSQEQEVRRIAERLRDDIVQRLTLVALSVDRFRAEFSAALKPTLDQLYGEISGLFKDTLVLSYEADPFIVQCLGLTPALEKLCHDTGAQSGITIYCLIEDGSSSLSSDVSGRLFRVAREALNNVIQHSQSGTASVEVKTSGGRLTLRIIDAGIGMDPQQGEGRGLTWMREQILSLEGTFKVTSAPHRGTIIEASVPMAKVFP